MMRYPTFCALALMSFVLLSPSWAASPPMTVTVIPFAARAGREEAWLSKGLSDLFLRHLAEIPCLAVVERDKLQAFLNEMDLGEAPLFDQSQALRLGRVAKVQAVVYGSYEVHASKISMTVFWLDLDKQNVLA